MLIPPYSLFSECLEFIHSGRFRRTDEQILTLDPFCRCGLYAGGGEFNKACYQVVTNTPMTMTVERQSRFERAGEWLQCQRETVRESRFEKFEKSYQRVIKSELLG